MGKMKMNKSSNRYFDIQVIILIIIIITFNMFLFLEKYLVNRITDYSSYIMEKVINQEILNVFDNEIYINRSLLDILIITMNSNDEIISVDFDLELSNEVLREANSLLIGKLNNLDVGMNDKIYIKPSYFSLVNDNLIINVPITFSTDNLFLSYLGPKVPVKIELVSDYYSNLETSIKEYGINTILVELYVRTTIKSKILFNYKEEEKVFNYEQLIASKVINGVVPEYYGGGIINSSPLVSGSK